MSTTYRFRMSLALSFVLLVVASAARGQYSGGSGTADDPYEIATAADLLALGERPEDYGGHFILTADLDLDPNLPGRRVFAKAVVAPDANDTEERFQGPCFTGVFDGGGHVVRNLHIEGGSYLGLFGVLDGGAIVTNLGLEDADVRGTGDYVGGLVSYNFGGTVTASFGDGTIRGRRWAGGLVGMNQSHLVNASCSAVVMADDYAGGLVGYNHGGAIDTSYSTGSVGGNSRIGGLAGYNGAEGSIANSYATGFVTGSDRVGGLVGSNDGGSIATSYSLGMVEGEGLVGGLVGSQITGSIITSHSAGVISGTDGVGGLVGSNNGDISLSYSEAGVNGNGYVGGLVGYNETGGRVLDSYSTGSVTGDNRVGGLVGGNDGVVTACYSAALVQGQISSGGLVGGSWGGVTACFWDVETSGLANSAGGTGLTTASMQDASTYLDAGWDFVGESTNGGEEIWWIDPGRDYPQLLRQARKYGGGTGEPDDPYLISTAEHLNVLRAEPTDWDTHFKLMADINMAGYTYDRAVIAPDTNDTQTRFQGVSFTGHFDGAGHTISHLTIVGGDFLGLFGLLDEGAVLTDLHLQGADLMGAGDCVGALVGRNSGHIVRSSATGTVTGRWLVGGLVGQNDGGRIAASCSSGSVTGNWDVGGLAGMNVGSIASSYSSCTVSGTDGIGGLIGFNSHYITTSYCTGRVQGDRGVGGLVGEGSSNSVDASFWDRQTSGQAFSAAGTGLTTGQMQTAGVFLNAGWDFADEGRNGTEDVWWMPASPDYPRLSWESDEGE